MHVHHAKGVAAMIVVPVIVGLLYAGHRVAVTRRDLDAYRKAYGYQTPTTGLQTCVLKGAAWRGDLIDASILFTDGAHNAEWFDIDGDGDLEIVADAYRADTLLAYDPANAAYDGRQWTRCVIDAQVGDGLALHPVKSYIKNTLRKTLVGGCVVGGAHYTAIGDLSGDGKADLVVAGDEMRDDVVWYEAAVAADGATASWVKHVAYRNDSHRTYHAETGDIDGDGDRDIVFATKTDNSLGWLENRGSPGAWPAVMIDSNCTRCFYARVSDLDNDGNGEIIASQDSTPQGGRLLAYAHSGNARDAANWGKHCIAQFAPGHGVSVFAVVDLDGDKACDIAAANHQGDVYVLKHPRPGDALGPWETHTVARGRANPKRDFREIDTGDIDLDGDPDIVVADEGGNAIVWYENPGPTFCDDWPEHVVDQSDVYLRWCHSVRLGDVDKDGDLDIAVTAAASNTFLVYLNQAASSLAVGSK